MTTAAFVKVLLAALGLVVVAWGIIIAVYFALAWWIYGGPRRKV
jgi:hypothetical protein